mmetsp:Transcript_53911/g.107313  ORF Transcript_53911/g.107313 Transcript_53911/m.107313 type:complete len:95 (+) Transcript_53911:779-1063(+)
MLCGLPILAGDCPETGAGVVSRAKTLPPLLLFFMPRLRPLSLIAAGGGTQALKPVCPGRIGGNDVLADHHAEFVPGRMPVAYKLLRPLHSGDPL